MVSSPSSPVTTSYQHPLLPVGTLPIDFWSSWSCPSPVTALMPRYDTRTVTSILATSSSKSKPESTSLGAEKTIGLRPKGVVNVIPGKPILSPAGYSEALI